MPFFPPVRNTRTRLKGGNSTRRMGNSRRPARRASHLGVPHRAPHHTNLRGALDRALGDKDGMYCTISAHSHILLLMYQTNVLTEPILNTSKSLADNTQEPQRDVLDTISDDDIPIPRPIPAPGLPQPSTKSDPCYINPFDDMANVLDTVSDSDIPIPIPPPPPPGSPTPSQTNHDHGFINPFDDSAAIAESEHYHGFIDPFDDTAIWKTLEQHSSMKRMIRELGEEVEIHQQTILSLKDGHAKELQKVRDEHAGKLKETEDRCGEAIKSVREKELATLVLEVENLENENVELKNEIAEMKKKIRDGREWGVEKIESMGYALEAMMFELENRMGDGKK